tara:strand:+ start:523 stop:1185 length:663 start_codon:yes stop_codon:yes gene_type:complete
MTVKINADTSDGLKFVSDTSGAIDLQSNGVTKVSMDSSGNITATKINAGAGGGLVLLDSSTLSSDASTIEISASTIGTTYNHLKLYAVAIPKTGSAFFLRMRDSSASVLNSVSDYGEQIYRGGGTDFNDSSVSALTTVTSGGTESGRSVCMQYDIFNLRSSSLNTNVIFSASISNSTSRLFIGGAGGLQANEDNQGLQMLFSSGDIATGSSYALYGVATS